MKLYASMESMEVREGAACCSLGALGTNELRLSSTQHSSMQASLGGGGGFEGFYGSVTANGVSRVYEAMSEHCGFGRDSFLVDIGGGVGRFVTPEVLSFVEKSCMLCAGFDLPAGSRGTA